MTRKVLAWLKSPLMVLLGLSVAGCVNNNMRDLNQYVEQVKARKGGHIEPLPEIKQIETFVYKEDGRRSPFTPMDQGEEEAQQAKSNGISPNRDRRKEELENYSLDSLRMVGTLEQINTMWALVETKDKTIYRVKAGNYLGQNHGQITLIDEKAVELTEIISDGQGGYRERQASLALQE